MNEPIQITKNAVKASCSGCRFGVPFADPSGRIDFRLKICRWGPPTPQLMQGPKGIQPIALFPIMKNEDWCHRFEPMGTK